MLHWSLMVWESACWHPIRLTGRSDGRQKKQKEKKHSSCRSWCDGVALHSLICGRETVHVSKHLWDPWRGKAAAGRWSFNIQRHNQFKKKYQWWGRLFVWITLHLSRMEKGINCHHGNWETHCPIVPPDCYNQRCLNLFMPLRIFCRVQLWIGC